MSIQRDNPESDIHPLLAQRWSPRAFDPARAVEHEKLLCCLEAARWAPSCFGDEPWRFLVCVREQEQDAWQRLLDCLAPKNREWAQHAPVLMLACAARTYRRGGDNRWGQYDTGQAAISLCLQAGALGLATHQMGGFDIDAARAAFHIPDDFTPMAAIALGYQGDATMLDDDLQAVETGPRQRRPLGDCFFAGDWEISFADTENS